MALTTSTRQHIREAMLTTAAETAGRSMPRRNEVVRALERVIAAPEITTAVRDDLASALAGAEADAGHDPRLRPLLDAAHEALAATRLDVVIPVRRDAEARRAR